MYSWPRDDFDGFPAGFSDVIRRRYAFESSLYFGSLRPHMSFSRRYATELDSPLFYGTSLDRFRTPERPALLF